MSRGFVKEGDQEEPPIIPPRASLPDGATNYVTPKGQQALLDERESLEADRKNLQADSKDEKRRKTMIIDAKLKQLNERIASARIVEPKGQPEGEVRFGAFVEYNNGRGTFKIQIVGVDEADFKKRKIAFTAPIAKAMIGTKVGETAEFKRDDDTQELEILSVSYPV